jgi:hypothetical protein
MAWSMSKDETLQDTLSAINEEKNSLRRFLAGITATTFGVLVALHPSLCASSWSSWFYVSSVIANAFSVIFFICSLFGRYRMLIHKGMRQQNEAIAEMQGQYPPKEENKYAGRFKFYVIGGLTSYGIAIICSCVFIVLEVLTSK